MEEREDTHGRKVETIKKKLIELNLPIHPLTVRSWFYVPDVITDIDDNLIYITIFLSILSSTPNSISSRRIFHISLKVSMKIVTSSCI